jgi:hypothetical protein
MGGSDNSNVTAIIHTSAVSVCGSSRCRNEYHIIYATAAPIARMVIDFMWLFELEVLQA